MAASVEHMARADCVRGFRSGQERNARVENVLRMLGFWFRRIRLFLCRGQQASRKSANKNNANGFSLSVTQR